MSDTWPCRVPRIQLETSERSCSVRRANWVCVQSAKSDRYLRNNSATSRRANATCTSLFRQNEDGTLPGSNTRPVCGSYRRLAVCPFTARAECPSNRHLRIAGGVAAPPGVRSHAQIPARGRDLRRRQPPLERRGPGPDGGGSRQRPRTPRLASIPVCLARGRIRSVCCSRILTNARRDPDRNALARLRDSPGTEGRGRDDSADDHRDFI